MHNRISTCTLNYAVKQTFGFRLTFLIPSSRYYVTTHKRLTAGYKGHVGSWLTTYYLHTLVFVQCSMFYLNVIYEVVLNMRTLNIHINLITSDPLT